MREIIPIILQTRNALSALIHALFDSKENCRLHFSTFLFFLVILFFLFFRVFRDFPICSFFATFICVSVTFASLTFYASFRKQVINIFLIQSHNLVLNNFVGNIEWSVSFFLLLFKWISLIDSNQFTVKELSFAESLPNYCQLLSLRQKLCNTQRAMIEPKTTIMTLLNKPIPLLLFSNENLAGRLLKCTGAASCGSDSPGFKSENYIACKAGDKLL